MAIAEQRRLSEKGANRACSRSQVNLAVASLLKLQSITAEVATMVRGMKNDGRKKEIQKLGGTVSSKARVLQIFCFFFGCSISCCNILIDFCFVFVFCWYRKLI